MWKKILIIFLLLLCLLPLVGYGQENSEQNCSPHTIELVGMQDYLVGEYTNLVPTEVISGSQIHYSLEKNGKIIDTSSGEKFSFMFQKPGSYTLSTQVDLDGCSFQSKTILFVYSDVVNIIGGVDKNMIQPYIDIFKDNGILINVIPIFQDSLYKGFFDNGERLNKTKNIIIKSQSIDKVLEGLVQLADSKKFKISNANIIIVNSINKNLLKRIISKYAKSLDFDRVYTTDNQNFINLIATLSHKGSLTENDYLKLFSLSEQKVPTYLFLSKMVDKLIYNGFPIDLIGLLLTISLAVLAVTLFRQVIGFDIFGAYTPLMSGLSIYILGMKLALILFFIAFIATVCVRLLTKKIYLLYSAKFSLLISLYFLFIFIGLSYSNVIFVDFLNFSIFSNIFVIFPMLLILLVSEKVFNTGKILISSAWWISLVEFLIVSYVVFLILDIVFIKNMMLSYPEIIIGVILMIVLAGRFSGLQLLEYIRFYPLLKHSGEDDEE